MRPRFIPRGSAGRTPPAHPTATPAPVAVSPTDVALSIHSAPAPSTPAEQAAYAAAVAAEDALAAQLEAALARTPAADTGKEIDLGALPAGDRALVQAAETECVAALLTYERLVRQR